MRKNGYGLGLKTAESSVGTMVYEEGMDMRTRTGIFRQLDNGWLAPVAARHSREEAQSLIASLEVFWPGPYIMRELPALSNAPAE